MELGSAGFSFANTARSRLFKMLGRGWDSAKQRSKHNFYTSRRNPCKLPTPLSALGCLGSLGPFLEPFLLPPLRMPHCFGDGLVPVLSHSQEEQEVLDSIAAKDFGPKVTLVKGIYWPYFQLSARHRCLCPH